MYVRRELCSVKVMLVCIRAEHCMGLSRPGCVHTYRCQRCMSLQLASALKGFIWPDQLHLLRYVKHTCMCTKRHQSHRPTKFMRSAYTERPGDAHFSAISSATLRSMSLRFSWARAGWMSALDSAAVPITFTPKLRTKLPSRLLAPLAEAAAAGAAASSSSSSAQGHQLACEPWCCAQRWSI